MHRPYKIKITGFAKRDFKAIPKQNRPAILAAVEGLKRDPRPPGAEALRGDLKGDLRIRVGSYRVIYRVFDKKHIVIVACVGARPDVYRKAKRARGA